MNERERKQWSGLNAEAQAALAARDYKAGSFAQQVAGAGVDAGELAATDRRKPETKRIWIPGVEIFSRTIHAQRHRGMFGEFVRRDEGILAKIGLWPKQWSTARMFAGTAKGFHIHPPSVPTETTPEKWHRRLFIMQPEKYALRRYDEEQWDVMFFVQGRVEMIPRDVRVGLPARMMRFFIDGDNHRSRNNVSVVIPPGVAHAIRVEGCEDAIMVYGTSTVFHPEFEGRIASDIETAELPQGWRKFLGLD
jgi:dTDP-4-dehydrorhamnose 3,5-epimerase-like enzyme